MEPMWIPISIGILTVIASLAGSWALLNYKVKRLEEDKKASDKHIREDKERTDKQLEDIMVSIRGIEDCVRNSVSDAVREFRSMLYDPSQAGKPFYRLCSDCEKSKSECVERIKKLESVSHDHSMGKMTPQD